MLPAASWPAGSWLIVCPAITPAILLLLAAAAVFGLPIVLPIGGADMPVVISLLNAFTGTAVAMAGFVIDKPRLIIAGALVGASGSDPDQADGRGDEPLPRRTSSSVASGPVTAPAARSCRRRLVRQLTAKTPRSSSATPARRSSFPATASPPPRPNTSSSTSPPPSNHGARRQLRQSRPSRAGCPDK